MPSWDNTPSGTMRAAVLASPGASPPSAAFRIDGAYPKPSLPSPEWLLVRVHAAGLNRAELRGRAGEKPFIVEFGMFAEEYHEHPPAVLGEEFVGVVDQAGAACAEAFPVGALVAGWVYGGGKAFDGAYAQYTIAHPRRCWRFDWPGVKDVDAMPWATIGAVPMSMWTAYGSLFYAAGTRKGDVVLVHGATSSVGIWAILLAKDAGCTVIATTRQAGKVDKLRAAGADHVLLEDDLAGGEAVRRIAPDGVNTILELVGAASLVPLDMPVLAGQGSVVMTGVLDKTWGLEDFVPPAIPSTRRLTFFTTTEEDVGRAGGILQEIMDKVRLGVFRSDVFLDKVFELDEVGQAHQYMEDNCAVGKDRKSVV